MARAHVKPAVPAATKPLVAPVLAMLLVSGCATFKAEPVQSDIDPPPGWSTEAPADASAWPETDWWKGFNSDELNRLMDEARGANPDLAAAFARVLQADARARIAGASLLPEVDLGGDAGRQGRIGGNGDSSFGLSLGAAYEVDLWGSNRADLAAARALVQASEFDQATVALTISAGVATSYLQVLSLRERLAIARLNLELAEDVLRLVEARVRHGAGSPLESAQQRAAVAGQRAAIPPLEQQEREARAALALLLGRPPQGFDVGASGLEGLAVPEVSPGLPSDLLRRRPDVRQAEMQLVVAQADIAIARAALFPSLRLTGSTGLRSGSLSTLFSEDPVYSVIAALAMPIFNAGRLSAGRAVAEARQEELLQGYRATILEAFADVDTTLSALDSLREQSDWQAEALRQADIALALAEARYRAGAEGLLTVLDAQRTLYQARDQQAQLRLLRMQGVIALFRALGGGWAAGMSSAGS